MRAHHWMVGTLALVGGASCGDTVAPADASSDVFVARAVYFDLDAPPAVSCDRVQLSLRLVSTAPIGVLPEAAFSYEIGLDAPDGGAAAAPTSNRCFATHVAPAGTTYDICIDGLAARSNYFLRIGLGFDAGMLQQSIYFGTPACSDAGAD